MSSEGQAGSIFDGTDDVIASFFGFRDNQRLKQRSVSQGLRRPRDGDFLSLVTDIFGCLSSNRTKRQPSRENWRFERVTTLSAHNRSPEVILERAVAMLAEKGEMPGWLNQVPVASGLVDDRSDKRAALDLVELRDDRARFIELKWESDTPAYAAFEILRYGLVYLFSRVNAVPFGYEGQKLLRVGHIDLQVAAPNKFFDKHDLRWLRFGLDQGIKELSHQKTAGQLEMGFDFLAIPREFELPFRDGAEARAACESDPPAKGAMLVRDAFNALSPIWPGSRASST